MYKGETTLKITNLNRSSWEDENRKSGLPRIWREKGRKCFGNRSTLDAVFEISKIGARPLLHLRPSLTTVANF